MKIAYIAHIRFPSERAHSVQIAHMANAFASLGHDVELFVSSRATAITERPEAYYGIRFNFKLTRVPIVDIIAHVHSFPKLLHPLLYNLERLHFAISFAMCANVSAFDVLYCRDEFVLGCLSLFYPRKHLVWESHEGKSNFFARRLLRRAHTVVISEGIKAHYVALGFSGEHITVAHDAIDDSFFETRIAKEDARSALGLDDQKPVAMYIGGFDAWKGVHTLFEAAALIPEVRVVVIGGDAATIEEFRLRYPQVVFLGPRPYRELREHQRAADVLVVPNTAKNTLSAKYTSPLKLFSHMASRVPIVLSDIPSLRAVLDDDSAYFCAPDSPQALADALTSVLKDPEAAQKRAAAAYEMAKRYTWQERAQAILKAIALSPDRE